jgi:hypothetical protein
VNFTKLARQSHPLVQWFKDRMAACSQYRGEHDSERKNQVAVSTHFIS